METGGMEMSEQKQKLGFLARTAQTFDLPADIVAGLPRIELIGNGQLQMEDHRGILSYREDEVVVSGGKLLVRIVKGKSVMGVGGETGQSDEKSAEIPRFSRDRPAKTGIVPLGAHTMYQSR